MTEDQDSLATISTEHEIAKSLGFDEAINTFKNQKGQKVPFLIYVIKSKFNRGIQKSRHYRLQRLLKT
jgi:hypothetical protein